MGAEGRPGQPRLEEALTQVAERIARHRGQSVGEQNTKATLIDPVLRALGWDVEDFEEVSREYRRRGQDKPVDYALLLSRSPVLFIEAKALGENLADHRWTNQVVSYASVAGVRWVLLTDGDEYRVYNAHAPVPVEEKLFRRARISQNRGEARDLLVLLTKGEMSEKALAGLWKTDTVNRKVNEALEQLFFPEPNTWLVRRLARDTEDLTEGDVRAALSRARITMDFPPPSLTPGSAARGAKSHEDSAEPTKSPDKVGIADLIEAGLISPPVPLFKTYLGRELSARIEPDGRVAFGGRSYNSPSVAASQARASVKAPPPGKRWHTNGWTWWSFKDQDGESRQLRVVRDRYLERQALATTMSDAIRDE